jgi:type III secretion system low calcium response chaperone LcrH/SycD
MSDTETTSEAELPGLTPSQQRTFQVMAEGGTLKDVRGLSGDDIETIYAIGFNLYNQAKYDQAEPMFQFACLYEHSEPRYWMALGNCRQMAKNYQGAIDAYGFSYAQDVDNPWAVIQAAICYLALKNKELAAEALNLADNAIAHSKPDEAASKRIAALRQAL